MCITDADAISMSEARRRDTAETELLNAMTRCEQSYEDARGWRAAHRMHTYTCASRRRMRIHEEGHLLGGN